MTTNMGGKLVLSVEFLNNKRCFGRSKESIDLIMQNLDGSSELLLPYLI